MKRRSLASVIAMGLILAGAVGLGAWALRGPLALALFARAFDRAMAQDPVAALPDGLHVGLCGSGSPLPDPTRAGPCAVVVAGRRLFVVDTGQGSAKVLALMNLPPASVDAVFLTHYHSDHIADLGEFLLQRWAGGAHQAPLPVYGPTGLESVLLGFEAAYGLDRGYRIAHHGPTVVPPKGFGAAPHPFSTEPRGPDVVLMEDADLKVVAFPVDHRPVEPAVGYLFIYKGRRVVISGDTAPSERVEAEAKDADVLVHEGLSPNLVGKMRTIALRYGRTNLAAIFHDILVYHTSPEAAAAIAERAHVRMLLFTHIIPPLPLQALNGPFLGRAPEIFRGRIQVGRDGDFVSLPPQSKAISVSNRLTVLF